MKKAGNLLINTNNRTPLTTKDDVLKQEECNDNMPCEMGVIDKLQHSYGFLQSIEGQLRLFFHFSEYSGALDLLEVGDVVKFRKSQDRRTGKPIAICLQKLLNEDVFDLSDKTLIGTIVLNGNSNIYQESKESLVSEFVGRVSYEEFGEHFFIPFTLSEARGQELNNGDEVTFQVATDRRSGNVQACRLQCLSNSNSHQRVQGVICSLKDGFGFIERSDIVKEIFFHYSECQGDIDDFTLGLDVEFSIQFRNGKEIAVEINMLPVGSVIFEDVGSEKRRGRILNTLHSKQRHTAKDPLAGRIVYETLKGSIEIPYGDKDQIGEYTLLNGDLVDFNIATDRRDKLQRATHIELVEETFTIMREVRECGFIESLKDGFGFIKSVSRNALVFFRFSEIITKGKKIKISEEVQFTVVEDSAIHKRPVAIRIQILKKGTLSFKNLSSSKTSGSEVLSKKESALDTGAKMKSATSENREVKNGLLNNRCSLEYEAKHKNLGQENPKLSNECNSQSSENSVKKKSEKNSTDRDMDRPERLISRLKSISDDVSGPKLIVIRSPYGPQPSKGFLKRKNHNL